MNHYSLKEQPSHGHTTPGSCMTIRIRGAPRIFRDLETDRRAPDDRVRGDPVVHCCEPVPHSLAVHRSTHNLSARAAANHKPVVNPSAVAQGPSTTPSFRSSCAAGGTNRCVWWATRTRREVLLQVERDGERRGGPRRQVIEELL